MAKALKVVGVVVAVVAIVAATGGLAIGGAAAASAAATAGAAAPTFLGMTAATLGTIATAATLASAAIGVGMALFAPKPSFNSEGNPLNFQTNPQSGLPYAIGRTRMSGLRIHADTYDATSYKSEGKQDALSFGVLLSAGGPIQEIESFRADKELVTFEPSTRMAIGQYSTWMAMALWLGGPQVGDTALQVSFGGGNVPGWTTAHKLSGMTHALWTLRYDPKGEKFGAGVPEPEWIGKWVKVYDPRKDSTYPGGSGSHRALNEATYEWSNNPALHALTWCLGRWQNNKRTLGIGAPVENIRVADFVEAANVAHANDWTCGGVEWSTDSKWSILKRMLQACGGEPTMTGAMIGCRVNAPRVSIATVTGDKLLDRLSMATTRSRRDRFNTVIPRFRSEEHDWEVISGSPVTVAEYVTEDGGQRTKEIDFPLVQSEAGGNGLEQAGQLAAYEIVNSREAGPWSFTVGPEYIGVKTGDCITLDVPEEGVAAQPVIVRRRSIDPVSFKISLEVETETEAKHDFALGKTTTPPPTYSPTPPDLTPPQPAVALWSLSKGFSADGLVAITIAGSCEFPGADAVLMEYRKVGDTDWLTLGKGEASSPVRHVISPVLAETAYEARVAYQSGNRIGPWRNLGPVTTDPDYFTNANDLNGLTPDQPSGMGVVTVAKTFASGNVRLKATYGFTANSNPQHKNAIDAFEHGVFIADTNAVHTMGTGNDEKWDLAITDLTVSSHPAVFVEDGPADKWYTLAVRSVRKVAKSVHPSGWIKGPIRQSAPFRPSATQNFTGRVNGYTAQQITDAFLDYSTDNNQNDATPPAVTGVTISSVTFPDSTGQVRVGCTYPHSEDPFNARNVDGYLFGVRRREDSSPYVYNTADNNLIVWQTVDRPDLKVSYFSGSPVNLYYTPIVIPFRRVATSVHPSGLILGTPAQMSPNVPHRPAAAPNFTGQLDGETAGNVRAWSGYANAALYPDGTVRDGKVITESILAGAINEADWVAQGATIALGTSDGYDATFLNLLSTASHLIVQFILDYQVEVLNPDEGDEFDFTVKVKVEHLATGDEYFSDTYTLAEVWNSPSASGTKRFRRSLVGFQHAFEGLPVGACDIGFQIETNTTCGVTCRAYRYLRAEDMRAGQ